MMSERDGKDNKMHQNLAQDIILKNGAVEKGFKILYLGFSFTVS